MFDPEFFPTPPELVDKLLEPYYGRMCYAGRSEGRESPIIAVLEPSAGKGDILNRIKGHKESYGTYYGPKLLAIEQNMELVGILRSKGYPVLAHDFLSFTPETRIDLIVMNPPFSVGARHLLHAWEILEQGDIACILNAETVRNPWTEERRLLAGIIEQHGTTEFVGQAFKGAERDTDVEVVIVRLRKDRKQAPLDFVFDAPAGEDEGRPDFQPEATGSEVLRPDQMGAMIRQYEMAKKAFVDLLKAREALAFYCQGIVDGDKALDIAQDACGGGRQSHAAKEAAYDKFVDGIRLKFWERVLERVGMEKYLTADLRKRFREFVEQQGAMALTKDNIAQLLETMMLNSGAIMSQAVVAVFDLFTAYYKENRLHVEGWKTNSAWKVNRKIILPNYMAYEFGRFRRSYWRGDEFNDIDKAMCYLSGKRLEDITTIDRAINPNEGQAESTFFRLKYFKKGTIHLEFKDEALWHRFNVEACKGKNWIGAN